MYPYRYWLLGLSYCVVISSTWYINAKIDSVDALKLQVANQNKIIANQHMNLSYERNIALLSNSKAESLVVENKKLMEKNNVANKIIAANKKAVNATTHISAEFMRILRDTNATYSDPMSFNANYTSGTGSTDGIPTEYSVRGSDLLYGINKLENYSYHCREVANARLNYYNSIMKTHNEIVEKINISR